MSTIALAGNPVLHSRTKDIELDLHFVREKVRDGQIDLRHVPSLDQVADVFTKPLSYQFFSRTRNKLNVCPSSSLELRGSVNLAILDEEKKEDDCVHKKVDTELVKKKANTQVNKKHGDVLAEITPQLKYTNWKEILLASAC